MIQEPDSNLARYLKMSGQPFEELMRGAAKSGDRLWNEWIPRALQEGKKLTWHQTDSRHGLGFYTLDNL